MKKTKILILCECAVMLALATVLSMITLWKMPFGGSLTLLSMLPVCLIGLRHGVKWGFFTAFVYSVIQLMLSIGEVVSWGLTPVVLVACMVLDYLASYTCLGICSLFRGGKTAGRRRLNMCFGIGLAMVARFLCHFVSGVTLWSESAAGTGYSAVVYSILYNGAFMLPELILTVVGASIIFSVPQMIKMVEKK